MRYLGYTLEECYKDPNKYPESQIRLVKDFAHDAVWDLAGTHPIQRAMGQKMLESKDDVPSPLEPIITDPEDLKKLPKKVELEGKEVIDFHISITKQLKEQVGDDVAVIAHTSSPFHLACSLRGAQNLYMDMYERPEFVKELVEYLIQPVLEFSKLQADAGADIIYTACPVASRAMISKKHYAEFVDPVHKRIFDHWKNTLNRKVLFHVCGDWSDRFDLVVDEGPDIIHVDKIDLSWLKKEFGGRVCINGNVGTTTTLKLGSPEEVKREAVECIKKAARNGGFMLGADCTVPKDTPIANMRALTESVMKVGNYPLNF